MARSASDSTGAIGSRTWWGSAFSWVREGDARRHVTGIGVELVGELDVAAEPERDRCPVPPRAPPPSAPGAGALVVGGLGLGRADSFLWSAVVDVRSNAPVATVTTTTTAPDAINPRRTSVHLPRPAAGDREDAGKRPRAALNTASPRLARRPAADHVVRHPPSSPRTWCTSRPGRLRPPSSSRARAAGARGLGSPCSTSRTRFGGRGDRARSTSRGRARSPSGRRASADRWSRG